MVDTQLDSPNTLLSRACLVWLNRSSMLDLFRLELAYPKCDVNFFNRDTNGRLSV